MKNWIFNASPLIFLGKINHLHLVEILSPAFRIPISVVDEIGAGPDNDPTLQWLANASVAGHFAEAPPPPPFLAHWDLGAGETAVLSLALAEAGSASILDDLAARQFAITYKIPLLGTLGILIRAKQRGIIDQVASRIPLLDAAGANLSQAVIARALALANESL